MKNVSYRIRKLRQEEIHILDDFLYEAIFIPEGTKAPPKEIIKEPELQVYVADFWEKKDDICYVAEISGKIAGAVWCRIMDDYGHVDEDTPSLAISVLEEFRQCGIGTALMQQMLTALKQQGYPQVSLSVQKANYAARMYEKLGFEIVEDKEEEQIVKEYFSLFCTFSEGSGAFSVSAILLCREKYGNASGKHQKEERIPLVNEREVSRKNLRIT